MDTSWACNLETSEEEKLPIEHIGGVPRLCFKYQDSADDWLCGVVPLDKANWGPVDIRNYQDLKFTFYEESGVSLRISLEDEKGNASKEIGLIDTQGVEAGQECEVSLNLHGFLQDGFNGRKTRLVKFIGINKPHFYVSNLYVF